MSLARAVRPNSRAYTEAHAGRQCEALSRHKRVSTRHKAVKVPFLCSRSAKIATTLAEKW